MVKKATAPRTRVVPEESDDSELSDSDDEVPVSRDEPSEASSSSTISYTFTNGIEPSTSTETAKKRENTQRRTVWKDISNDENNGKTAPAWNGALPDVPEVLPPIEYFRYFFDNPILDKIVEQSNLFALQQDLTKPLQLKRDELEQFLGTVIYMSIFGLPKTRLFWSSQTRVSHVADEMLRDRWQAIKANLHFNDNSNMPDPTNPDRDRLFKIRPLVDFLLVKFQALPQQQMLSVDEQITPFKGRSSLRQYIPSKPYKWGYKPFMMCDTSGLVHNFEIYTGKILPVAGKKDIGASGNIVLKMAEIVSPTANALLFFDNWFSSLSLFVELAKQGILSVGTMRSNRLGGCILTADAAFKKKGRGSYEEKQGTVDGVDMRVVKWYDNRVVTLASSFAGAQPVTAVRRWDKSTKQYIDVSRPSIVGIYNQFMGGVDAVDALIAYYRIHIRSKKFYHRFFFHFIDMAIVCSWLLYRRDCRSLNIAAKQQQHLLDFRMSIAHSLCRAGKDPTRVKKRGRPSAGVEAALEAKRHRGATAPVPQADIRTDGIGHWPEVVARQRCKMPFCDAKSVVRCMKCKIHLCLNANKNCFMGFHR